MFYKLLKTTFLYQNTVMHFALITMLVLKINDFCLKYCKVGSENLQGVKFPPTSKDQLTEQGNHIYHLCARSYSLSNVLY